MGGQLFLELGKGFLNAEGGSLKMAGVTCFENE